MTVLRNPRKLSPNPGNSVKIFGQGYRALSGPASRTSYAVEMEALIESAMEHYESNSTA